MNIPSKKEAKKKEWNKKKGKKWNKGRQNKGRGRGEEDEWKTERKKKRVGIKYLDKKNYCVGTEPSELVYIGILVTSAITGHGGSVVSALSSQAKGRGSFPSCGISFFSQKYLSFFPFQPLFDQMDNPSIWSDFVSDDTPT